MGTTRYVRVLDILDIPESIREILNFQIDGDKIEAIEVKIGDDQIRITKDGTYTDHLKVVRKDNKVRKLKYRVVGKIEGVEILPKEFDTAVEAADFINDFAFRDTSLEIKEEFYYADRTDI